MAAPTYTNEQIEGMIRPAPEGVPNVLGYDPDSVRDFLATYAAETWQADINAAINQRSVRVARCNAAIKWSAYIVAGAVAVLAGINLGEVGGKAGATAIGILQIILPILAGVIKFVCDPMIETANNAKQRLSAVRTYGTLHHIKHKPNWVEAELAR